MVSSQARRDQVALAMERGHSQRQACELIELPRSILKYRSRCAERDAPALDAMRRIAATYPRYGYRRVRIFLHREGHAMSPDRAYRLWRTAGLQWFRSRTEARVLIEIWRRHYNALRPHSSLDYRTPNEYRRRQSPPTRGPSSSSLWSEILRAGQRAHRYFPASTASTANAHSSSCSRSGRNTGSERAMRYAYAVLWPARHHGSDGRYRD